MICVRTLRGNAGWSSKQSKKLKKLIDALKPWLTRCLQKSPRATPRASRHQRSINSMDSKVGRYAWFLRCSLDFDPPAHQRVRVELFVNRMASVSSKSKFPAELLLNPCFPQTQIPALLSGTFKPFSREYRQSQFESKGSPALSIDSKPT
jgi:hypothetical protein